MDWNCFKSLFVILATQSPPTRRCGLKFFSGYSEYVWWHVTSYAEVWIEIFLLAVGKLKKDQSPPTRRCGLKFPIPHLSKRRKRHLLRGGVDWNICFVWWCLCKLVTSYAEVWIEIGMLALMQAGSGSPPTRRCGLKWPHPEVSCQECRHLLRGGVDWNANIWTGICGFFTSPPTRRCGLKFRRICWLKTGYLVTSYAEVWIEILRNAVSAIQPKVTSYAEVWIEIWMIWSEKRNTGVTSYAEVWIEMPMENKDGYINTVTSYAEVWIEIMILPMIFMGTVSPPTRRCGLK